MRIARLRHDPRHHVAFGENADESFAVDDRNSADVPCRHDPRRVEHGGHRVDGDGLAARDDRSNRLHDEASIRAFYARRRRRVGVMLASFERRRSGG